VWLSGRAARWLSDSSLVVLVCPSFLLNRLLSWAKTEELLLEFLGHNLGHDPTGPMPGPAPGGN